MSGPHPAHSGRPGPAPTRRRRNILQAAVRLVVAPLARLIYRPVTDGRDNVPLHGPVILAANHLSFIDSIVIPLAAPRPVAFLAKAEYFRGRGVKGRLIRALFTATDAVAVERGTHHSAHASLQAALDVLGEGRAFGIYPEGTRSRDGRLYRGRTGVAWLALASGAPVVPVAVLGTERVQPVGARLPRMHRLTVRFGAPLRFTQPAGEHRAAQTRRAVTDEIMDAIRALSGQQVADGYHHIPSAEPAPR